MSSYDPNEAVSHMLQDLWTLDAPAAEDIDWLTTRKEVLKWATNPASKAVAVACYCGNSTGERISNSAVRVIELVNVRVLTKGDEALRKTAANHAKSIVSANPGGAVNYGVQIVTKVRENRGEVDSLAQNYFVVACGLLEGV